MFLSFEGIDGSGKTTQLKRLAVKLEEHGREVVATREPGGTRLAEAIRALLLDKRDDVDARAELLLFGAARAQHVAGIIRPTLGRGAWVVSDRYADSSEAYQGSLGLDSEFIRTMNAFATEGMAPRLTFFLDVSPEVGYERRRSSAPDRIESRGLGFLADVRAAYLRIAQRESARFVVLNGELGPDELETLIWNEVAPLLSVGAP